MKSNLYDLTAFLNIPVMLVGQAGMDGLAIVSDLHTVKAKSK